MEIVKKDSTSKIVSVMLRSSTTGAGLTGVAAASMSGEYTDNDNAASTSLSFSTGAVGDAYSSGKWAEVGNGEYYYHMPDAVFDQYGVARVKMRASGAVDVSMTFQCVAIDPYVALASAVWDELQSSHTTAGTFGKYLDSEVSTAGGGATAGDIADAVWDEARSGHVISGSFGEQVNADVVSIDGVSAAATNLAKSAGQILPCFVDTVVNGHTPTTTELQSDTITELTTDHYNGRVIIFTDGNLVGQATSIQNYSNVGGIGQFTVVALTEAPSNNDSFIIV